MEKITVKCDPEIYNRERIIREDFGDSLDIHLKKFERFQKAVTEMLDKVLDIIQGAAVVLVI